MKPLICLVNAKEDKITLTLVEFDKICDKFYEAGIEDGRKCCIESECSSERKETEDGV